LFARTLLVLPGSMIVHGSDPMNNRYVLGAAALAVVLALAGTFYLNGSPSQNDSEEVNDMAVEDSKTVEIDDSGVIKANVGEEFVISLKGNVTTGYQWSVASCEGLNQVSDWYVCDDAGDPPRCGVGGTHYFKFSADNAGTYKITLDYARGWESGPVETETFTVIVA